MDTYPLISVVVLNYNGKGYLEACLRSVLASDYPHFEVVVVDNASTDGSLESIAGQFPGEARVRLVRNTRNLLFAGGNNAGIRDSRGEYVVILNNDTEVEKDWLKPIALALQDRSLGACQPKVLFHEDRGVIDNAGGVIDRFGFTSGRGSCHRDDGGYDAQEEIFFAGGAALAVKKSVLDEVGLFDEDFGLHWEDVDLCWRIRLRGYHIRCVPASRVYHKVSLTFKQMGERKHAFASYHIRKNRLAGLVKNYHIRNLFLTLPAVAIFYILLSGKELCIDRKASVAFTSFSALWWNARVLGSTLRKRRYVQHTVRSVPDAEITKYMRGALFFKR